MRQWLLGITCTAMLAAVARSLMPNGAVRQVGNLICAMMLLWAVLKPLNLNMTLDGDFLGISAQSKQSGRALEEKGGQILKTLIEQECGTYIVDKAAQMGITCTAQVSCVPREDGIWLPEKAVVSGCFTAEQRRTLARNIAIELGIDENMQEFIGGE